MVAESMVSPNAQAVFNSLGRLPANRKVKSSLSQFK